jgi:hypothetical protein
LAAASALDADWPSASDAESPSELACGSACGSALVYGSVTALASVNALALGYV